MALSDVLAELYGDASSAKRVAQAAGVDVKRVAFDGTAANTWAMLVDEAVHQKRLAEVVRVAFGEYPDYEPLLAALFTMQMPPPSPKDGFMNLNNPTSMHTNESEAVVIAKLAAQLEGLTLEVRRVSDGLNSLRGLNVDRIEQGLEDLAFMRGRIQTLSIVTLFLVAAVGVLGLVFFLHV